MGKRAPTLPVSRKRSAPNDFALSDDDWRRLETAYGRQLIAGVRAAILAATKTFLSYEEAERTVEPRSDAKKWAKTCKAAADKLWRAMTISSKERDAPAFAQGLVAESFRIEGVTGFQALARMLPALKDACDSALAKLNDPAMPSFRKGRGWGRWVRALTEIAQNSSLPRGVSKDETSKSRFLDFVWELQKLLPPKCRRHAQSKRAMAKAIWLERIRPLKQSGTAKAKSRV